MPLLLMRPLFWFQLNDDATAAFSPTALPFAVPVKLEVQFPEPSQIAVDGPEPMKEKRKSVWPLIGEGPIACACAPPVYNRRALAATSIEAIFFIELIGL